MPPLMRFFVTIYYRKPAYAQVRGVAMEECRGTTPLLALTAKNGSAAGERRVLRALARTSAPWVGFATWNRRNLRSA
jgi:hypothetical protein